ncbi:MAG: porphobilinogen synthase [Flavobacteriales bacterium]|jgi:porphobilinogen synthase|nr:porphobilinogen synthase [Flavobacteriales bacterium]MBT3963461.1 porphobilinogen synthase [Flavobacteriales bacterium]MBT4706016.1 porphobilinogen synthase [Flavobacteriales bacterium]MBT4931462.1 porphobilinogen synthase [Flavobacteriales bacterium]MBT5131574.1 porphobilinogen synthase [Flavobacteriales bacterium]
MLRRPRRNRKNEVVRSQIRETKVEVDNLIYPLFMVDGQNHKSEVKSLPGQFRLSLDNLLSEVEECMNLGVQCFDLFPAVDDSLKDELGTYSYSKNNFYLKYISEVKKRFPEAVIMTDVAMDPYSSDGHDGIVRDGKIINDETLDVLARMSVAQAEAGADIIGPSDMMDGRVEHIRDALDDAGFSDVSIMSYTAKYASAFYGPFRDALDSAPKFGDKKTYQMDPANKQEALIEAELDYFEGADYLMVKPALCYLDVIHMLKEEYPVPIAAYNVSGEYAMLKAAAQNGWLEYDRAMTEMLLSIKRAGADVILTYFAKDFAQLQK